MSHRHFGQNALRLPVFGYKRDSVTHRMAATARRESATVKLDCAGFNRLCAEHCMSQFRASRSHQAKNPQDFPPTKREIDIVKAIPARQPLELKCNAMPHFARRER